MFRPASGAQSLCAASFTFWEDSDIIMPAGNREASAPQGRDGFGPLLRGQFKGSESVYHAAI